jgi:hypothetical protein
VSLAAQPSLPREPLLTFSRTGNAILLHGFAWSYNPSNHRISIDNQPAVTIYANSSLANTGDPGYIYTDGLIYFQANLSSGPHHLTVDNDQGVGFLGLDYIEVISIAGGTPYHPPPTVIRKIRRPRYVQSDLVIRSQFGSPR